MPRRGGSVALIEARASRTPQPLMTAGIRRLAGAMEGRASVRGYVVHRGGPLEPNVLAPGVAAVPLDELIAQL